MRLILAVFLMILPLGASAQVRDSVFTDYAEYDAFVDKSIMTRDFVALVLQLGGRDEYTPEQLAATKDQLGRAFPVDFTDATVFRRIDLGGGFSQEARAYWTANGRYAFYFAFLHQRDDGLIVMNFNLNSNPQAIMDNF
ncbi:MAG: hypothetical protein AB8B51_21790 [Sedimentitalea sp.]